MIKIPEMIGSYIRNTSLRYQSQLTITLLHFVRLKLQWSGEGQTTNKTMAVGASSKEKDTLNWKLLDFSSERYLSVYICRSRTGRQIALWYDKT